MAGRGSMVAALGMALIAASVAAPAGAQAGASIHLEISGGGHPGTYDVTTPAPCSAYGYGEGTDEWSVYFDDPDQDPSSGYLQLSPADDEAGMYLTWADGVSYDFRDIDHTIEEEGDGATIAGTAHAYDDPATTVSFLIECREVDDQRLPDVEAPAVTPVPVRPTWTLPLDGDWSGTITIHASTDHHSTEPGADDNPNSAYYETWETERTFVDDISDTFTVVGTDPSGSAGSLQEFELSGSAAIEGTTQHRFLVTTNKQNSGCTWIQEDGDETTGAWSESGAAIGVLQILEDGSYHIDVSPTGAGPAASLPHRTWLKYSDISANCEVNEPEYDLTELGSPNPEWASIVFDETDQDCVHPAIDGRLDPAAPPSVIEGSLTWQMGGCDSGFGFEDDVPPIITTLTADWHLVREDGPAP